MIRKSIFGLILIVISVILLSACTAKGKNTPPTPAESTATLSNFSAEDLEGNEVDESIFSPYKLTMINIWGTYCDPCIGEMPDLAEIAKEYEEKGVQVIGIPIDTVVSRDGALDEEQVELAREIVEETGADYTHLLPSADLIEAKLINVTVIPETFFVDSMGEFVGKSYAGARSKEDWIKIIEGLLQEVK